MKLYYLFILLIISSSSLAQDLSFFDKLAKFEIEIALPIEHHENDYSAHKDKYARYDAIIKPNTCDCELRYIIQHEYIPGPFLPPHAEMIRLLGSIGSNGTNSILIEQFPEESESWSAMAHFSPKTDITDFSYGTISTYFKTDGPLIHVIAFYNNEKESILAYLDSNRY